MLLCRTVTALVRSFLGVGLIAFTLAFLLATRHARSDDIGDSTWQMQVPAVIDGKRDVFVYQRITFTSEASCKDWLSSQHALEVLLSFSLSVLQHDKDAELGEPVCSAVVAAPDADEDDNQ